MARKSRHTIALFGEAEKGQFRKWHTIRELPQLVDALGNPPQESQGLFFAIQALLYQREVLYCRVEEEGFSVADYFHGLQLLEKRGAKPLHAICIPGVGEPKLLEASQGLCHLTNSFLITTQKDLYDYLTAIH